MKRRGSVRDIRPAKLIRTVLLWIAVAALLPGLSSQGTLIITIPTEDGMLVASDKLLTIRHSGQADGHVDGTEKVRLLSPTAAVGFAGLIGMAGNPAEADNPGEHLFAVDFAKYYFITNRVDDFDPQKFADSMSEQVSNYFAHLSWKYDVSKDPGCVFLVFRATPARERRTFMAYLAFGQSETNLTVTSTHFAEAVQRDRDPARVMAFGQPDVPLELEHGTDPRFDDLRNNWMIAKFLPKPPLAKDVGLADAELFAQSLMAAASERTILLNTNAGIGSNIDETVLSF